MKKIKKLILGIILVLSIIIALLIGISIGNRNTIQKQLEETQKLTATSDENSYITTADHLAEVNSSVQSGIEQGKLAIWESIRNSEVLSGKTDSSGNPIYGNVTDIESLENAISSDNDISLSGTLTINMSVKVKGEIDANNSTHWYQTVNSTFSPVLTVEIESGVVVSKTLSPSSGGWCATGYVEYSSPRYGCGIRSVSQVESISITSVTWTSKAAE